jgi:hypothetical protein
MMVLEEKYIVDFYIIWYYFIQRILLPPSLVPKIHLKVESRYSH